MDIASNENGWNFSDTAHFNGIPCRVFESVCIILDPGGKSTRDFVESGEFEMLERAGFDVH